MNKLVLTGLDDSLMSQISELATLNHVSLEEQTTNMLKQIVRHQNRVDRTAVLASIAAMTPKNVIQTDSVEMLREDRDR